MQELEIIRVGHSEKGTFGVLRKGEVPFALTLEPPWRDNAVNVSSIPAGIYLCKRVQSPQFGNTFEVSHVPGRTNVLFHKGNTIADTKGCILVAEEFGGTPDNPRIVSSERGYREFMDMLAGEDAFLLVIVDAPKPDATA